MNREETKEEIQKLWIEWPERKEVTGIGHDTGLAALSFYISLKDSDAPILAHGDFGIGDPYQIIHAWILEWMRTWGKKQ